MAVSKTIRFSGEGKPGDLLDPNNWVGGAVPGVNDIALITTNVGGPVGGTFKVGSMMLLGTETITFTGTLDTVSTICCQGLMVCDDAVAIFTPGATLNDANTLIVGNDDAGTLLAQGVGSKHSVINSVVALLGKLDDGVGSVTINDATWNNSGAARIGVAGAGTLNVINNGSANFGDGLAMAVDKGSSGHLTILSGGSVEVKKTLWVGGAPSNPGGAALVNVGSGGSLTVDLGLHVGDGSTVSLGGGTVTAGADKDSIEITKGGDVTGYGTLATPDGQAIADDGIIRATGGDLVVDDSVGGKGAIQIAADSTATITGSSLRLASIAFIGPDATLTLAHGSDVTASISGFAIDNIIAMAHIDAVTFAASTGTLTLSDHNATIESLHLVGNFTGDTFSVQQTTGDALITLHHG